MRLLEIFSKDGAPDRYRLVWDKMTKLGVSAVWAMTADGYHGEKVYEQYSPGGDNSHLGESVWPTDKAGNPVTLVAALGDLAFDGFLRWASVADEYGRDEQGNIIKEDNDRDL